MPLPALLTIQSGISPLRYATLLGIKKAKTKPVQSIDADELGVHPAVTAQLERVYAPRRTRQTEMVTGSAAEVAARLTEILKREVRVI
jgi:electron transfer flavoprotein beta subunit